MQSARLFILTEDDRGKRLRFVCRQEVPEDCDSITAPRITEMSVVNPNPVFITLDEYKREHQHSDIFLLDRRD